MLHKLAAKRVEKGIKQCEFAKQLGITPQYLRLIEKGDVEPRITLASKMSKILGVDIKDIFTIE